MPSLPTGTCPGCGTPAGDADNFCEACGRELGAAAVSAGAPGHAACQNCPSSRIGTDGYCEQCGRKARSGRDHVEVDLPGIAGVTDRGLRHLRNEDAMALALTHTPGGPAAVAVVCDGVSTSERPDDASLVAADRGMQVLAAALRAGAAAGEALLTAAAAADTAVRDLADSSADPPAATYVSGVVTPASVTVCWIGDSRAYWLPAGSPPGARLLTSDDSLGGELVAAGLLTEADTIASRDGHTLTRWLGADADALAPHTATFEPAGPGVLLLCSDGLWNYQPEANNLARLALPRALTDRTGAAADLLGFALDAGGHDNITIVLIAVPPAQSSTAPDHRSTPR
jgi:serine/threonine protein phosphatase PrpC